MGKADTSQIFTYNIQTHLNITFTITLPNTFPCQTHELNIFISLSYIMIFSLELSYNIKTKMVSSTNIIPKLLHKLQIQR